MKPVQSQPASLYGTAKTHKLEHLEDITVAKLNFRSISDQTGKLSAMWQTSYRII